MRNAFASLLRSASALRWSVSALLALCFCPAARAALVPTLEGVTPTPDGYLWTYRVSLGAPTDMRDDGTIPTAGVNPEDDSDSIRDYLTFYDIAGLVTNNPSVVQFSSGGFDYRIYSFGATPGDTNPAEIATPNVTLFRTSGDLTGPTDFFVALLSSFGSSTTGEFASEATNRQLGTGVSTLGSVTVPAVPEPASAAALTPLLAAGLLARRPRQRRRC